MPREQSGGDQGDCHRDPPTTPLLPRDEQHRGGPVGREIEHGDGFRCQRGKKRPVKPEQLDEDDSDGEVEDVVEGRREPFPEERSDCDLDRVRAEGNEPRSADPTARSLRRYLGRRRRARRLDR